MAVSSLTEALDNLYTTTWEIRKNKAHDNIFSGSPFWYWMKEKGKLRTEQGGRFIMEPLEYAKNDSVQWITKGGTVSLNDFEFLTESKWDWKYLVGNVVRFGVDDQQNRGKAAIMKLVTRKLDNLENSMIETLEEDLFSVKAGDAIEGLPNLVPDDPTGANYDVGGIDQSAYSWWRNQSKDMTSRSFAVYGLSDMRTLIHDCMKNRNQDQPDIIVCGQTPYEYYEDETMEQKQIVNKKLGDAGFTNIEYKGIPMIWSPSAVTDAMYFLNTKYLYFMYDPIMNFDMTPWKDIPDQVNDRAAQVILACAFIVTRRLCQGVMYDIDTA